MTIPAGSFACAPVLGDIQVTEGVDQVGQGTALGLFGQLPIGHALEWIKVMPIFSAGTGPSTVTACWLIELFIPDLADPSPRPFNWF